MSKETKIGLLVSLGVILVFAMILSLKLSGDGQPVATTETAGSDRTKIGGDAIDRQAAGTADQPAGQGSGTLAVTPGQSTPVSREESGTLVAGNVAPADPALPPGSQTADLAGPPAPQHLAQYPLLPPPVPARQEYVVQRGDTLAKIADKVYGAGQGATRWHDIAAANPGVNTTRLRIGSKLVVPALAPRTDNTTLDRGTTGATTAASTYTVVAGDSLGVISQKVYGTSKNWKLIQKANPNVKPTALRIGTKLKIPAAPGERQAAPVEATRFAGTVGPMAGAGLGYADTTDYAAPSYPGAGPAAFADSAAAPGSSTPAAPPVVTATPGATTAADSVSDEAFNSALDSVRDFVSAYADRPQRGGTYKVVPGDTLGAISQKLFGTSNRWQEIYALNRDKLPRPTALRPGMELRLPNIGTAMTDVDTTVAAADLPR